MLFIRNLQASERHALGDRGEVIPLVDPAHGSGQVDVHINVLRAGGPPGRVHYHPANENIYVVLQGAGRFVAEDREYRLRRDDVVFIPPGTRHSLSATADEGLTLLEIFAPTPVETIFLD